MSMMSTMFRPVSYGPCSRALCNCTNRAHQCVTTAGGRKSEQAHVHNALRANGYPEWALAPPPCSALAPPPSSALAPPPCSALAPTPSSALAPPPCSALAPPPSSALAPPPCSALAPPPSSAKRPPNTNNNPRRLPNVAGLSEQIGRIYKSHNIHTYHKPVNTLCSMVVHPKDRTPKGHQCGTIYNITCDIRQQPHIHR